VDGCAASDADEDAPSGVIAYGWVKPSTSISSTHSCNVSATRTTDLTIARSHAADLAPLGDVSDRPLAPIGVDGLKNLERGQNCVGIDVPDRLVQAVAGQVHAHPS
jgi:hypothetical protein